MQRQLPGGLVLRTLSENFASDRAQLPEFYAAINGEGESEAIAEALALWTQDLINDHPLTRHDDIFVVVDPAHEDRIVSATLLIPQTWRYEEIPILVGRPELVGTHPDYRGRGLVRALFAAVHERSAALGHQIQGITGIPYFYRQFGYTMAMDLDGRATLPMALYGEMPPGATPAFTLREATEADIADLITWQEYLARTRLVSEVRSTEVWRHELLGHNARSLRARSYLVIVNGEGEGVGYVELSRNVYNKHSLYCPAYVVGDKSSYLQTFDDVMRAIYQWARGAFGECPTLMVLATGLHESLYRLVDRKFGGDLYPHSYKWYLRVPDPIAFLRHIQPVLERRLEDSGANCYTGELKIGFYDLTGIALQFERGRMVDVRGLQGKDGYSVSFPWHLFWNVVFGDLSVWDIYAVLPDVATNSGKNDVLIEALFPKKTSWLEGLA
jgi:GNAT superfamily N-acetyltransferase